jgi:formate hydrogenlyase subunit 6/NADH:ubiquinone oxidoreductase subunit I
MKERLLPLIDLERCIGCGLCAERCPGGVVEMVDARPAVRSPEACTYCGDCEDLCPTEAIALRYEIILPNRPGANR